MTRRYSLWLFGVAAGLLLFSGLLVVLSVPQSAAPNSARAYSADRSRRAREAFLIARRGLNFGVPAGAYRAAIRHMRRQERAAGIAGNSQFTFSPQGAVALAGNPIGPKPLLNEIPTFGGVPLGSALSGATGRVTALLADPTVAGRMFVGAGDGGVWMRSSGAAPFASIFDARPTQAVGSMFLDTTTAPNSTLYVGSGEGNNSGDSYYGQGVFVTTDLGVTWSQLGAATFAHSSIAGLTVDTSQSPRVLYAAVTYGSSGSRADASWIESDFNSNGLWRSDDGGGSWIPYQAGTFGVCPYFTNRPCPASAVVIDRVSPNNILVSILGVGIYRSSDSGFSWTQASLPNLGAGGVGRASIALGNGMAYAMVGAADGVEYSGFYSSTDGGITWTKATVPSALVGSTTIDGTSPANFSQSWFDQVLTIDPADATGKTVVFGGVGIYKSINAGGTWTMLASVGGTHSDQHAIAFDPASAHSFFAGNDGGLYRFDNGLQSWSALNPDISVLQAQSIGPHPTNNSIALAGFQDNGTARFDGTQPPASGWTQVDGLDGGIALFDAQNALFAYHVFATSAAGPALAASSNAGVTFSSTSTTTALRAAMAAANDPGAATIHRWRLTRRRRSA